MGRVGGVVLDPELTEAEPLREPVSPGSIALRSAGGRPSNGRKSE
jgi:hypothetical protein